MSSFTAPSWTLLSHYQLSAIFGIASHVLYFSRGHRDREALGIVIYHLLLSFVSLATLVANFGLLLGCVRYWFMSTSYVAGLLASMAVYRLFFHRLRQFPGPLAAKVTNLYSLHLNRNGKMHEAHVELFETYGDFVRVGPNELMVLSVDALSKLHSAESKCRNLVDPSKHHDRRQVWESIMTEEFFRRYEECVLETCRDWLEKLGSKEQAGKSVDMLLYSTLIANDIAGRAGFSKDFGGIRGGTETRLLQLLDLNTAIVGQLGLLAWPLALGAQLGISPEKKEFEALAVSLVNDRAQEIPPSSDIMGGLLQDYHSKEPKSYTSGNALVCDAQVILSASTLNIRPVLTFSLYFLAKDPHLRKQLREAIRPFWRSSPQPGFRHSDLRKVEILDAIIHETMRLYNPTCDNAPRVTPPKGLLINHTFIPGEVIIHAPIWAYHRSQKYFEEPNSFLPERWTTRPELVIDKRAYHPFLLGPHACVGKDMSYTLLRMVISDTVWNFDFEFAPGEDGTNIDRKSRHAFFLKPGELELIFKKLEL